MSSSGTITRYIETSASRAKSSETDCDHSLIRNAEISNSTELLIQVLCNEVQITFISSSMISVRQSYGSLPASEISTSEVPSRVFCNVNRSPPSTVLTHDGKMISRVNSAGGRSSGMTESNKSPCRTLSMDIPLLNRLRKSLS